MIMSDSTGHVLTDDAVDELSQLDLPSRPWQLAVTGYDSALTR